MDEWRPGMTKEMRKKSRYLETEPAFGTILQPIAMRVDELTSGVKIRCRRKNLWRRNGHSQSRWRAIKVVSCRADGIFSNKLPVSRI